MAYYELCAASPMILQRKCPRWYQGHFFLKDIDSATVQKQKKRPVAYRTLIHL